MTSHEEETLEYKKAKMGIVFTCVFLAHFLVALWRQSCTLHSKTPGQLVDVTLACVLCIHLFTYTHICVHTRTHTSTCTCVCVRVLGGVAFIGLSHIIYYYNIFLYVIRCSTCEVKVGPDPTFTQPRVSKQTYYSVKRDLDFHTRTCESWIFDILDYSIHNIIIAYNFVTYIRIYAPRRCSTCESRVTRPVI
jgi:hypothetical protein